LLRAVKLGLREQREINWSGALNRRGAIKLWRRHYSTCTQNSSGTFVKKMNQKNQRYRPQNKTTYPSVNRFYSILREQGRAWRPAPRRFLSKVRSPTARRFSRPAMAVVESQLGRRRLWKRVPSRRHA
jgi:hypothetical protein